MKVGNGAHRRNHTAGRNRKAKRKKGGKTGRRGRDEERQVNRVEVGEQRGENRENTDIYIFIQIETERRERERERAICHGGIDYIEGRRVAFLLVDFCGNRATARAR